MIKLLINTKCILGESPRWCKKTNSLFFVDILDCKIYRYEFNKKRLTYRKYESIIGNIDIVNNGKLIVAFEKEIAYIDYTKNTKQIIISLDDDLLSNRPNDGKLDPKGRYWFSTMNKDEVSNTGRLWRLHNKEKKMMSDNFIIGNGIDWDMQYKKMYFTDSVKKQILIFDYDLSKGEISNKRIFYKYSGEGVPDGLTVDINGNIWSAIFGGSKIIKINSFGKIIQSIKLPVPNPTSLIVIDKNIYVTTAKHKLSKNEQNDYSQSGAVFQISLNQ